MIIRVKTQVLAKYVLLPLIEVATDPDCINRWILKALKKAEKDSERKQTGSNSGSPDKKPRKQQLMKMDSFETGTSYQVHIYFCFLSILSTHSIEMLSYSDNHLLLTFFTGILRRHPLYGRFKGVEKKALQHFD